MQQQIGNDWASVLGGLMSSFSGTYFPMRERERDYQLKKRGVDITESYKTAQEQMIALQRRELEDKIAARERAWKWVEGQGGASGVTVPSGVAPTGNSAPTVPSYSRPGDIVKQHESWGINGAVNMGDGGGMSAGPYQINQGPKNKNWDAFAAQFPEYKPWLNTGDINTLASQVKGYADNPDFVEKQRQFVEKNNYAPVAAHIAKLRPDLEGDPRVQEMAFSLGVQHGPERAKQIIALATDGVDLGSTDPQSLVSRVYDVRSKLYPKYAERYSQEVKQVNGLASKPSEGGGPAQKQNPFFAGDPFEGLKAPDPKAIAVMKGSGDPTLKAMAESMENDYKAERQARLDRWKATGGEAYATEAAKRAAREHAEREGRTKVERTQNELMGFKKKLDAFNAGTGPAPTEDEWNMAMTKALDAFGPTYNKNLETGAETEIQKDVPGWIQDYGFYVPKANRKPSGFGYVPPDQTRPSLADGGTSVKYVGDPTRKMPDNDRENLQHLFEMAKNLDGMEKYAFDPWGGGPVLGRMERGIKGATQHDSQFNLYSTYHGPTAASIQSMIKGIPSNYDAKVFEKMIPQPEDSLAVKKAKIELLRYYTKEAITGVISYNKGVRNFVDPALEGRARALGIDIDAIPGDAKAFEADKWKKAEQDVDARIEKALDPSGKLQKTREALAAREAAKHKPAERSVMNPDMSQFHE